MIHTVVLYEQSIIFMMHTVVLYEQSIIFMIHTVVLYEQSIIFMTTFFSMISFSVKLVQGEAIVDLLLPAHSDFYKAHFILYRIYVSCLSPNSIASHCTSFTENDYCSAKVITG
jgi:hypothetical protein